MLSCLGVSAAGVDEEAYRRVTYDFTISAARTLAKLLLRCGYRYFGAGARVRGKTENALLQMPFKAVLLFRRGHIQPFHGIQPKTK
jgi:hypothetical protein